MIDSRHEQAPDSWLQHIYHLTDKDNRPPILVVVNEYENCHNPQNQTRLQRLFGNDNLQFFHFNCRKPTEKAFDHFKKALLDVAKHSRHSTSSRLFDASDYLKTLFAKKAVWDINDLEDELKPFTTASIDLDTTLAQLEHLGRIVNLIDPKHGDNERFCLNSTWVVDHAYQLLNSVIIKNKQGIVAKNELRRAAKKEFPNLKEHFNDLMYFLQNSRVCKLFGDSYFFPDMTTPNEPPLVNNLLNDYKNPHKKSLIVEFHLPYIPIGLAAHLACYWLDCDEEEIAKIIKPQEVWREGFILRHKDHTESLLIKAY